MRSTVCEPARPNGKNPRTDFAEHNEVAGYIIAVGFEYLFGLKNFAVQLLMTAATATVIGLSFGVVIELDYPFRGDISVSPERWVTFHDEVFRKR